MSELSLQINQVDLKANNDLVSSCDSKKQDESSNFDEILKSISQETVETAEAPETAESKKSSDNSKICQNKVSKLTTSEVDEYIELRPKDMSLDARCELDDKLFCIADQSTDGTNEEIKIVDESCKLKFSFVPVEMHYEVSEQDKTYSKHIADIDCKEFIEDIDLLKIDKKNETNLTKVNLTFTASGPYSQGKQIAASNLPFISTKVDTNGVVNNDFTSIKLEFNENISNADYQYGYENYYNNTKPITEGRMNFSLDSIETKLVNQVTFSISKAVSSKENNTIVQLEPAELGKIEIIVTNQGKERNIVINSDKISTFELLRKHNDEFLNNVKFGDTENDVTTNLTFNYKDLSGDSQNQRDHKTLGKDSIMLNSKNDTNVTGWGESRMSCIFLTCDLDKNIDVWV